MWFFLLVFVLSVVIFFIKNNGFYSIFVSLSIFYIILFFVFPVYIIENFAGVTYLGRRLSLEAYDYIRVFCSFLFFFLGFFLLALLRGFYGSLDVAGQGKKNSADGEPVSVGVKGRVGVIFWVFLAIVFMSMLVDVMDAGRAMQGYSVRQGVERGSRVSFLLDVFLASLSMSVLFVAMSAKKNVVVIAFLLLNLYLLLTAATGRGALLVYVAVICIYFFNIRANKFVFMSFLMVPVAIPILVNLKDIIYSISVLRVFPDILLYYRSGISMDVVMANFGHPLVSLLYVDELLDLVGYRYFYDYFHGFLFYFNAFGIDVGKSLTYFNTQVLLGKSESIIPTGYLAFGFAQLSYFGVFVSGVFYSFVGDFAKYIYQRFGDVGGDAAKFYFANAAAYTFYVGELRTMVIGFVVPMVVVLFSSKFMIK